MFGFSVVVAGDAYDEINHLAKINNVSFKDVVSLGLSILILCFKYKSEFILICEPDGTFIRKIYLIERK